VTERPGTQAANGDPAVWFRSSVASPPLLVQPHQMVLCPFRGRDGVLLTVTGPAAPTSETLIVGYLPDGDDYIILAAQSETGLPTALRTATSTTAELANQQISVDIAMLTNDTDRAALLNRLLKHVSIDERHEMTRHREVPIARLTPHYKPASNGSLAFSGIWAP
jgi:hypothetical protein